MAKTRKERENEMNQARSLLNRILEEGDEESLNYLKEIIDIRLEKEPHEYPQEVAQLMVKYGISLPNERIRLTNLSVFHSDVDRFEVEQRKKQVANRIAYLAKQREKTKKI